MRLKKAVLVIFCFIGLLKLNAKDPLGGFINDPALKSANISILIRDMDSGKSVCQYRSQYSTIPASTLKIITTATALELLGPDFQFQTQLQIKDNIDENGVLQGNLYIYGGGDPTLGSEFIGNRNFLIQWVNAIKKAGIKSVAGSIIADDTLFDHEGFNPRWIWEDIGNYYAPGVYGLSYMDNMVRVHFTTGEIGSTPTVLRTTPEIPGLTFENNLKCTTIDSIYFSGAPRINHRIISGEIPANKSTYSAKMDMPLPGLLLAVHLHDLLIENGISVSFPPATQAAADVERKTIYTHTSPSLSRIIKEINFKSNNHYAEHVFRYLALKRTPVSSTTAASIQVIRNFWKSKGLPVEQLFMYDGSGLSPSNAVSSDFFVGVLDYMYKQSKYKTAFYESLPVAGESGTIAGMLKNTSLEGKVHAKSGSISRVRCYTGYIEKNEKTYAFSVLVNNYTTYRPRVVIRKIEELLVTALQE